MGQQEETPQWCCCYHFLLLMNPAYSWDFIIKKEVEGGESATARYTFILASKQLKG
jgi:hypothetical protein